MRPGLRAGRRPSDLQHLRLLPAVPLPGRAGISIRARIPAALDLRIIWRRFLPLLFAHSGRRRARRFLPGNFRVGIHLQPALSKRFLALLDWSCAEHRLPGGFQILEFFHGPLFRGGRAKFLPLGISFFTFEFIHYAVDRYEGKTEAGSAAEYLSFILYFPTMVAGPIKRYQDFLPKVRNPSKDTLENWRIGCTRILTGLAKKFCVADVMTAFTNHLNKADILTAQRWVLPLWLLAYGMKIYFDFSGYSDIAIGSARLFGIRVPENFDWPYFQVNIAEFWRHWHISLTRWLIDYVFIPLGGSRVANSRIWANLMVTMLVSGVWHGAGLNFVVWGAWHGALLVVHRIWIQLRGPAPPDRGFIRLAASWAGTFLWVNLGWAFFSMDLSTALLFFRRLVGG